MDNEIQIKAEYSVQWMAVRLYGRVKQGNRTDVFSVAQPLTFNEVDAGSYNEPFLTLSMEDAEVLLQSLWDSGVRPRAVSDSLGELNATKTHLKDMQRLVFDGVK